MEEWEEKMEVGGRCRGGISGDGVRRERGGKVVGRRGERGEGQGVGSGRNGGRKRVYAQFVNKNLIHFLFKLIINK